MNLSYTSGWRKAAGSTLWALILVFVTITTPRITAQPSCSIEFSQCPKDTSLLACPNSPNGFTLTAYPPVSAYVTGSCPAGATLFMNQLHGPTLPAAFPPGSYLIGFRAWLEVGGQPILIKDCTYTLTILPDNQPPVFTYCPPSITIHGTLDNNGDCKAIGQWPVPIFTDNCGPFPFLSGGMQVNIPCGSMLGTGTITYTAYDSGGNNSAVCSFTVTVLCPTATEKPGVGPYNLFAYPNPGNRLLTVAFSEPALPGTRLRLVNLTGQPLVDGEAKVGQSEHTMDTSGLPPGMYFIVIERNGMTRAILRWVCQD